MEKMPEITKTERGSFWKNTYKTFEALVYVPLTKLNDNELNYSRASGIAVGRMILKSLDPSSLHSSG